MTGTGTAMRLPWATELRLTAQYTLSMAGHRIRHTLHARQRTTGAWDGTSVLRITTATTPPHDPRLLKQRIFQLRIIH